MSNRNLLPIIPCVPPQDRPGETYVCPGCKQTFIAAGSNPVSEAEQAWLDASIDGAPAEEIEALRTRFESAKTAAPLHPSTLNLHPFLP